MQTARYLSFVAALPTNEMMVVGGGGGDDQQLTVTTVFEVSKLSL